MTQLDKLEMLNSHWQAFARCGSDDVKDYAKILIMYLITKQKIGIENVSSSNYAIELLLKRQSRKVLISVYGKGDCDIHFVEDEDQTVATLDATDFFGIAEILIEMWFREGMVQIAY